MNGVAGPSSTFCSGRPLRLSSTGATHQHAVECRASVRVMSHVHASTSGRCWPAEAAGRSRARRVQVCTVAETKHTPCWPQATHIRALTDSHMFLQVSAALFEPPPFQSSKLTVQYLPGAKASSWNSSSNGVSSSERITSSSSSTSWRNTPATRRYTLTHNDVTGALTLSIGADYNQRQVQGFYTRILRDEITAEWYFTAAGSGAGAASATVGASAVSGNGTSAAAGSAAAAAAAAPAELHIYCHVSGEERWLAPPQLRNFIFRREMTLVSSSGSLQLHTPPRASECCSLLRRSTSQLRLLCVRGPTAVPEAALLAHFAHACHMRIARAATARWGRHQQCNCGCCWACAECFRRSSGNTCCCCCLVGAGHLCVCRQGVPASISGPDAGQGVCALPVGRTGEALIHDP